MPCVISAGICTTCFFAVTSERRELLWAEMDRCLELADRLTAQLPDQPMADGSGPEPF